MYWVTQKLLQIYTANHATFPIRIRKFTVQTGADTGFRRGGARFLGTKPYTKFRNKSSKFRNKSSKFRYKNRAKRDKAREAQKICEKKKKKIFAPP